MPDKPKAWHEQDGGYKSRKLWFSVGMCVLMWASAKTVPEAVFSQLITGYISILTIFSGASTFTKWISSNHVIKSGILPKEDDKKAG